ncbi:MAG: universal stress protein [Deltaproteobacteria bacterium]|nr:universal stress protein [Deltaproteobacteria bacterium]MBW1819468.1 universal stress protein [Deltaproteobacteria bacterium]
MAESMKILCPTDGSRASEKGIDFAINFADNFSNVEVTFLLITRISADQTDARYLGATLIGAAEIQDEMELDNAANKAKKAGFADFKLAKAYARRNIAAAILDYAEKEGFNHVIMGSTGRTGVERILIGSVASEVVAKAHCPVTIVR